MKNKAKCKKIAFVTHMYYPSNLTGSCITIDNLAKAFRDRGYDVSVIVSKALEKRYYYIPLFFKSSNKKYEVINGIKVYRLNCNQAISFFAYFLRQFRLIMPKSVFNKVNFISRGPYLVGLTKVLKKDKFDVIFTSPLPYYLTKQVADAVGRLDKKPLFILKPEYHFMLEDYNNPEFRKVFEKADIVNVWTKSEQSVIEKRYSIKKDKIKVIQNALSQNKIKNEVHKKEKNNFVERYKLKNRKIILYAGVKSKFKGAIFLMKAVNELYKRDKSYLLVALGQNTLGWDLSKNLIDPNCVLDLGYVDTRTKELIFDLSDIYCMPSISEALGLSYLEAWYRKKPVICAKFPVTEEIIGSVNGGLMVEFDNQAALESAIDTLFKNKKLAKKLGQNGYKALMGKYIFDKGIKEYDKLFN